MAAVRTCSGSIRGETKIRLLETYRINRQVETCPKRSVLYLDSVARRAIASRWNLTRQPWWLSKTKIVAPFATRLYCPRAPRRVTSPERASLVFDTACPQRPWCYLPSDLDLLPSGQAGHGRAGELRMRSFVVQLPVIRRFQASIWLVLKAAGQLGSKSGMLCRSVTALCLAEIPSALLDAVSFCGHAATL